MKAVVYGAGHIGRGFIGSLLAQAGYEVVFIDIDADLVDSLNAAGGYSIYIVGAGAREERVTGFRAVHGRDEDRVAQEIATCDIMATALGAGALRRVTPLLARGLSARWQRSRRPLDILLCENLKDSSALVRSWLAESLRPDEAKGILANTGLVEAAIGRMVPDRHDIAHPLNVYTEEYAALPVNGRAFVAPPPDLPGLVISESFAFYEERKLYLHNMGHAICAYLGQYVGHAYLWEAIADPRIRLIVQNAMTESAIALSTRHSIPILEIQEHIDDLMLRFSNLALADTCERVGRDPARKLAPEDRLVGAAGMCAEQGVIPASICIGIAAATLCLAGREEAEPVLTDVCGLSSGVILDTALIFYDMLRARAGLDQLVSAGDRIKRNIRGGPKP